MKHNVNEWKKKVNVDQNVHYLIEGQGFTKVTQVFSVARERGFTGGITTIIERLKDGDATWERLCRPPRANGLKKVLSRKKQEMAEMLAAYDARKAMA